MSHTNARYAFISAYLKGEEARIVSAGQMEEVMRRAGSIQEALEIMGDSDIGEYLLAQPITTFDDADTYLWRYMGECLRQCEILMIPPEMTRIVKLYVEKYDVLNIMIKLWMMLTDETASFFPLGGIYNRDYLEKMSDAQELDDAYEILAECNLGDYIRIIENGTVTDARAVSETEVRLRNHYNYKVLNTFRHLPDGQLLVQAFESTIDTANLQTIFRLSLVDDYAGDAPILSGGRTLSEDLIRELLTMKPAEITGKLENTGYHAIAQDISREYEKTRDISVVDAITDTYGSHLLKDLLAPRVLSTSTMLWYLMIKEREIRKVRLVFRMLTDGIPADEIRDMAGAA